MLCLIGITATPGPGFASQAAHVSAQAQPGSADDVAVFLGIAIGDHWNHTVDGGGSGHIDNQVVRRQTYQTHFGDQVDVWVIEATGTLYQPNEDGGTDQINITATKRIRYADHAVVDVETFVDHPGGSNDARSFEAFDPPLVETVFPFTVGTTWRSHAVRYLDRTGSAPLEEAVELRASVDALENITVAAGDFEAWRINVTKFQGGVTSATQWYAKEVCDIVGQDRLDADGATTERLTLEAYRCSQTSRGQPTYDAAFVEITGAPGPPSVDVGPGAAAGTAVLPGWATAAMAVAMLGIIGFATYFVVIRRR